MELESLHADWVVLGPVHAALAMAEGFVSTEACAQGQESKASHGADTAVRILSFQTAWILQVMAEHLHSAANPEDGTA